MTSASVFFLSVLHALHDSFRKLRSFVFIERISEVTEVFEDERDFREISRRISREGGVADVSGYTDYGRVWREFYAEVADELHPRATVIVLGDARTNGREPHAEIFAEIAERAGPNLLAQPRAEALLELRRLGHVRLRGALHRRLRVLDDQAPRGIRERGRGRAVRAGELMRRACKTLGLTVLLLPVLAGNAAAAVVSANDAAGEMYVAAKGDEVNTAKLRVDPGPGGRTITFFDSGTPPFAGPGCEQVSAAAAECFLTPSEVVVDIGLAGGDDRLSAVAETSRLELRSRMGGGNDVATLSPGGVCAEGFRCVVHGGPGEDRIFGGHATDNYLRRWEGR